MQDRNFLDVIDKSNEGRFFFSYPQHIDFDNNGNLYVMDSNSYSIKVIDIKNKELLATLVHEDLHINSGLAVDSDNNIHISGLKKNRFLEKSQDRKPIEFHTGIMTFEGVF